MATLKVVGYKEGFEWLLLPAGVAPVLPGTPVIVADPRVHIYQPWESVPSVAQVARLSETFDGFDFDNSAAPGEYPTIELPGTTQPPQNSSVTVIPMPKFPLKANYYIWDNDARQAGQEKLIDKIEGILLAEPLIEEPVPGPEPPPPPVPEPPPLPPGPEPPSDMWPFGLPPGVPLPPDGRVSPVRGWIVYGDAFPVLYLEDGSKWHRLP